MLSLFSLEDGRTVVVCLGRDWTRTLRVPYNGVARLYHMPRALAS